MFSRACQIGIRASLYLALRQGATFVNTKEISEVLHESNHFVAKVMHQLTKGNILHSYRGPNGGLALIKDPKNLYIIDIIRIIDGVETIEKCILGRRECSGDDPCPLHKNWDPIRGKIMSLVKTNSLYDVAQRIHYDTKNEKDNRSITSYLR